MKYSFFKISNGQKYEVSLQVIKGKIKNTITFNFPITETFTSQNHHKGLIKIIENIDFSSLDNTIDKMEKADFQYLVSQSVAEQPHHQNENLEEKINYVKIWMDMYFTLVGVKYLIKENEAVILVNCMREISKSEAAQLFNIFLVCNEWWADVKSIKNFVDKINQVRLVISKPKTSTEDLKSVAKTVNVNYKPKETIKSTTSYSHADFESIVLKYNNDTGQILTKDSFMQKFGYEVSGLQVIKKM